ncbi:hypothetical protein [Nocardia nepalensis]|uniref:hypothetical protein n=1 Tax=Nocardia nepalensis TaxID=3375448 RepID=UPI003B680591
MPISVRIRLWIEIALAIATAALAALTVVTREWIEIIFGVDPDRGSGALEWAAVAGLCLACVACTVVARVEWRRHALGQG